MTYSSSVYGLLTRIQQQNNYGILPKQLMLTVLLSNASMKAICLVSQLHTNYISKNYFINGFLFKDNTLKFHDFFST